MPLVAVGAIFIALGVILALFVSTTFGVLLAVVGIVALVFGFATYNRTSATGGDRVIVRDRPVRTRVVEREREIL